MSERPRAAELVIAGNINVNLERVGGQDRDKDIATVVVTSGLEDPSGHFFLIRIPWCRDSHTWVIVRQGREVRSQTYYILGSDCRIFQNVAIWYLRHNSNHLMVVGCLHGASPRYHLRYL